MSGSTTLMMDANVAGLKLPGGAVCTTSWWGLVKEGCVWEKGALL